MTSVLHGSQTGRRSSQRPPTGSHLATQSSTSGRGRPSYTDRPGWRTVRRASRSGRRLSTRIRSFRRPGDSRTSDADLRPSRRRTTPRTRAPAPRTSHSRPPAHPGRVPGRTAARAAPRRPAARPQTGAVRDADMSARSRYGRASATQTAARSAHRCAWPWSPQPPQARAPFPRTPVGDARQTVIFAAALPWHLVRLCAAVGGRIPVLR
jgi:hypothetical protein